MNMFLHLPSFPLSQMKYPKSYPTPPSLQTTLTHQYKPNDEGEIIAPQKIRSEESVEISSSVFHKCDGFQFTCLNIPKESNTLRHREVKQCVLGCEGHSTILTCSFNYSFAKHLLNPYYVSVSMSGNGIFYDETDLQLRRQVGINIQNIFH